MVKQKNNTIHIRKASGERELFDVSKLKSSLQNAGADKSTVEEIAEDIKKWMYNGINTKKIYARAFSLLQRKSRLNALRYKLKQSLFELGPTGYPFEHFIGEIFKKQGFETEVGRIIEGRCISHEIDVIATNNNKQSFIECKYSHDQGKRISIQVPLYVRSRVDDIIEKRKQLSEFNGFAFSGWVVTNSRFSSDSIYYGKCSGLHLLAWDYPDGNGLKDIIERVKIFPITILNHLTKKEKQQILEKDIVSCSQLLKNMEVLNLFKLSKMRYRDLLKELNDICS